MENALTPSSAPAATLPARALFEKVQFPAPGHGEAVPNLRKFDSEQLYQTTLVQLHLFIKTEYGTVKNFCDAHGIDRFNLSKCFNAGANESGKEMSVGLYLRCAVALGMLNPCDLGDLSEEPAEKIQRIFPMSLREYLLVNNNAVLKSIMMIVFS